MAGKMKIPLGTLVRFRGTTHPERPSDFVMLHEDGPDVFEAVVSEYPYGICYGLRWPAKHPDAGEPLGLPFHDSQLELIK